MRNLIPLIPFVVFISVWLAGETLARFLDASAEASESASRHTAARQPYRSRGRK